MKLLCNGSPKICGRCGTVAESKKERFERYTEAKNGRIQMCGRIFYLCPQCADIVREEIGRDLIHIPEIHIPEKKEKAIG